MYYPFETSPLFLRKHDQDVIALHPGHADYHVVARSTRSMLLRWCVSFPDEDRVEGLHPKRQEENHQGS